MAIPFSLQMSCVIQKTVLTLQPMRLRLYILALWIATAAVVASGLVLHHHHETTVCFVEEQCTQDGRINDEHTTHQEHEQENCQVHQMQSAFAFAKDYKTLKKTAFDYDTACAAIVPTQYRYIHTAGDIATRWQQTATPLSHRALDTSGRRGPPTSSLS